MMKNLYLAIPVLLLLVSGCGIEKAMDDFARNAEIVTPDLAALEDGSYTGKSRSGVVSVKVRVAVDGGRITGIEILRHFNGQGEAAEAIIDDVIEDQSLEVDSVTGATYSSKVILKAIEAALRTPGTPVP